MASTASTNTTPAPSKSAPKKPTGGPRKHGAIPPDQQKTLFWNRMPAQSIQTFDAPELEHVGIHASVEEYEEMDPFNVFVDCLQKDEGHVYSLTLPQPWPLQTKLHCWNCAEPFSGRPIMIPRVYNDETYSFSGCVGVFCTIGCAMRYILDTVNTSDRSHRLFVLNLFAERVLNLPFCRPAPHPSMLKKFGGKMNIDEYRAVERDTNSEYQFINVPGFIPESFHHRILRARQQPVPTTSVTSNDMDVDSGQ